MYGAVVILIIAAILSNLGSSFSVRKLFKFLHRIDLNRFPTMMAARTAATSDSSPAAVAEPGGTTACPGPAPVTEPDARGTKTEPGTHGTTAASTGPAQNKRTRRLPFDVSPSSKWISKTPPAKRPSAEVGPPPPGHAFVMPTGQAPVQEPVPDATGDRNCRRRLLVRRSSVDTDTSLEMQKEVQTRTLKADGLKDMEGLTKLAEEHALLFSKLLNDPLRPLGPNRKLLVASACSGTGADMLSCIAIRKALGSLLPDLEFEYVFLLREGASETRLYRCAP